MSGVSLQAWDRKDHRVQGTSLGWDLVVAEIEARGPAATG